MSQPITAEKVKELRERTSSPMMDCKKALVAAHGDVDAAIEIMRKSGQLKAEKKANRTAADGIILTQVSDDGRQVVMLEINSETDFVARDDNFRQFAEVLPGIILKNKLSNVEDLSAADLNGKTVEEARQELVVKVGENIKLRRLVRLEDKDLQFAHYTHSGRIGVLVSYRGGDASLGKDLAMHIAASQPLVIHPEEVNADLIAKEKEIFVEQAQSSGKPAEIINKMVEGRIKKFLDEVSLLGQPFIKDPETSVGQLLKTRQAEIISFVRYGLGEGITKEVSNFAEEVEAQARAAK